MSRVGKCTEKKVDPSLWSWGAGVQEHPKQTSLGHLQLIHSKGRGMSGSETGKEFISARPASGRQRTSISKTVPQVLKILPGLYQEDGGQGWRVHANGQRSSGQSLSWGHSRRVLIPIALRGSFGLHHRVLCSWGLLLELRDKLERT